MPPLRAMPRAPSKNPSSTLSPPRWALGQIHLQRPRMQMRPRLLLPSRVRAPSPALLPPLYLTTSRARWRPSLSLRAWTCTCTSRQAPSERMGPRRARRPSWHSPRSLRSDGHARTRPCRERSRCVVTCCPSAACVRRCSRHIGRASGGCCSRGSTKKTCTTSPPRCARSSRSYGALPSSNCSRKPSRLRPSLAWRRRSHRLKCRLRPTKLSPACSASSEASTRTVGIDRGRAPLARYTSESTPTSNNEIIASCKWPTVRPRSWEHTGAATALVFRR
mmetsp:Transcript_37857/g.100130  ORF Transcript_37857/g.100130 Transcript_37857/m.100130 type:complete len:277 (+) Transcript_37857:3-833(+)